MIIKIGILVTLILGALIFLGIKMGESIKQQEIKIFFMVLYLASIFTLGNIILSVYFFVSLRDKRGPIGPKGKKGEMGDQGEHGTCIKESCLKKSLETLMIDTLENNNFKDDPLNPRQKKGICKFVNELYDLDSGVEIQDILTNTSNRTAFINKVKGVNTGNFTVSGTSISVTNSSSKTNHILLKEQDTCS
jgi:hypothetical protein